MCEIPVFYATTEGQTRRIAERLATLFKEHGLASAAIDVESERAALFNWRPVRAVLLGASLHTGRHQSGAARFVRAHQHELAAHPSAFFSVSLSIASANPEEVVAARALAQKFADETSWRPDRIVCVAGRLAYTQYGFLKRYILRRIARKEGGPTDTSRDHELTDWAAVAALAADVMGRAAERRAS